MAFRSLAILASATASLVSAQEQSISALPAVTGPAANACGGCYVVADVAGIIFGGVQTQTQTNLVGVGRNGSQTTTMILENSGKATFISGAPVTGLPTSFNPLSSVITVGGATLTSPTSYEVFSAYSVTRTVSGPDGSCSVSSGSATTLATASSYAIPENAGPDFLLQVESSFITALGFPSCSAGGGNVQSTIHSMVTTTTQQITTTGVIRPTPVAVSVQASSTSAPTAAGGSTVVVFPNATSTGAQGTGSGGATFTISPAINSAAKAAPSWAPWATAMLCGALLLRWI